MKLYDRFLDILFPPRCIFCQKFLIVRGNFFICAECKKLYTAPTKAVYFTDGGYCRYALNYTGPVRQAILSFKFKHCIHHARTLAQFIVPLLDDFSDKNIDVVTWVPTYFYRLWVRGYNQSELLTKYAVGNRMRIEKLLKRRGIRPPQFKTKDRAKNVANTVFFTDKLDVRGKNILLIDDIVTSGATLMECRRVLFEAGAERVYCASLAHHERFNEQESGA